MGQIEKALERARRTESPARKAGARRYSVQGAPRGAHVEVTVPARFVGRWRFVMVYPGVPDVRLTARVYCGADRRLKFAWSSNPGAGLMRAFESAANRALADLGGSPCA